MLNVLVVDDDVDNLSTMSVILGLWGHKVRIAKDGKIALVAVEEDCPDVMLLDLAMPGMSGLELANHMRRAKGRKPLVITVSGFADRESQQKAMDAGAHLHLAKPVDLHVLKGLLERHADPAKAS